MISGSFAKNNLQLKASYGSSQPCTDKMPKSFDTVREGFDFGVSVRAVPDYMPLLATYVSMEWLRLVGSLKL